MLSRNARKRKASVADEPEERKKPKPLAAAVQREEKEKRDQDEIKKHRRDDRACPFVVLDQVNVIASALQQVANPHVNETTVFTVTAIQVVYNYPVAGWRIHVKYIGGGDAKEYPIQYFKLFAKHNDLVKYDTRNCAI